MSLTRLHNFAVSLDGFGTGEGQSREEPFGHAGERLHLWRNWTPRDRLAHVDGALEEQHNLGIGAEIMGRNKFTHERGPWSDPDWRGWWGDNPPFHTPTFVLTHYPRPPIEMEGGTTFHFIDATPQEALAQAKDAAGDLDVRIGGGATMVRDFLAADLIDYAHITIVPIVLGRGVRLWDGLEGLESRFDTESVTTASGVTHLLMIRKPAEGLQR
jgi:dihydrofolate reductase